MAIQEYSNDRSDDNRIDRAVHSNRSDINRDNTNSAGNIGTDAQSIDAVVQSWTDTPARKIAEIGPVSDSHSNPVLIKEKDAVDAAAMVKTKEDVNGAPVALKVGASEETVVYPHRMFSLRACFDKGDISNKEISVASSNLSIAEAAIIIARAIPNPQFSLIYGWGPAWEYIIGGNNEQVGWSEEIQVAGRRTKKVQVARAKLLQTAFQVEAVRFSVHNRIRRAYAELAAANAYASLVETQREIAQRLWDISKMRYDAGKAPGSEVLQAKLAVMQFETQRNSAQGRLVQDAAAMSQLLGEIPQREEMIDVDDNALFKLTAQKSTLIPEPDRDLPALVQLLPAAWRQRNDLKQSIQQAYANKKAIALAKTQRIPDPTVGFNYLFSAYKPFQARFFDPTNIPSNNIPGNRVPFQPGYQITYQQETPVFYQYQGQIDQAKANYVEQLKQTDQLRTQVASGIVTAYEALVVTRANIKKYQLQVLPAAERVAHMALRGYQLGKMDLATAILAQQQYQQLRSNYFDAVVAYQNAWSDMENAVGVPLNL